MDKSCYDGINIILTPKKITYQTKSGIKEKTLNLTIEEIRRQLKKIGYICPYTRETKDEYYSEKIENHKLPYMNFIYYYELFKLGRIPTFEEFYKGYLTIYCNKLSDGTYTVKNCFDESDFSFTEKHLIGRVFRSYNSFHREVEFLYQLANYDDIKIQYSLQDDLNGIDFIVDYKGKQFGLASYIASKRSYKYKQAKNTTRHDYTNIKMIDVIARFGDREAEPNCDTINGIYVYSPSFVASKYFEISRS